MLFWSTDDSRTFVNEFYILYLYRICTTRLYTITAICQNHIRVTLPNIPVHRFPTRLQTQCAE